MYRYDVAVIGAGPAGSMAARYASKRGADTVLLEEHKSIGWPVECAGLLGLKALKESELSSNENYLLRSFRGATIYSPFGKRMDIKAPSARAWAVDRSLFDRALAMEALRAGAELRLGAAVRAVSRDLQCSTLLMADGEKIRARVVISAEGVGARIARQAGIKPVQKVLSGAQLEAPFSIEDLLKVEVHLGVVPGLFAWVIPIGEDSARIGLCSEERGCQYLRAFLKTDLISRRLLGSPVALNVGGLPMGPPRSTVADGLLAVGDAAGQVKPTSGGGIYPGLVCAKIAGRVAAAAALEKDGSKERLQEYERLWHASLGRELEIGMRMNRMLNRMNPSDLDETLSYLANKPHLLKEIEKHGDIDRPSRLMIRMLPHLGTGGIRLARLLKYALS